MEKQVFDPRGRQASIARLFKFDKEAFVHMIFYRALIFLSIAVAIVFILYYLLGFSELIFESAFILVWVFFTPQVYETAKGISVMATMGVEFGYLNRSYMVTAERLKTRKRSKFFRVAPYAALAVWVTGLITLSYLWFV